MARVPAAARTGAHALVALLVGWLVATTLVPTAVAAASTPGFAAVGSAHQVYATGLPPGASASLLGPTGHDLTTQRADALGGVLFRNVPAGGGYRVRLDADGQESGPLVVHTDAPAPWDPGIYGQAIPQGGYGYLTTRDGTKLAIDVRLPLGSHAAPYPTVIEYSGYGYADPAGPQSGIATLAQLMGFAVVDVNMRGTGCSGGAFDYFEPLQNLDGYDVIETVAHQPWVLGHKVGMIGISYGAISQLFTAQLDPPDLEAIAPLSTIDATASTLYPGGILNTGFATGWAQQRQADAEPAGPSSGQAWAYRASRVATRRARRTRPCTARRRTSTPRSPPTRTSSRPRPTRWTRSPSCTRSRCPSSSPASGRTSRRAGSAPSWSGTSRARRSKWFTFTNGAHIDSLDPATFDRWYDFLELFVAHRAPATGSAAVHAAAPLIYQSAMGLPSTDSVQLPPDPIQQIPTYQAALAAFDRLPELRVLFDNGAGAGATGQPSSPGNPYPGFEVSFSKYPVPSTTARTWYLGAGGALATDPPASSGVDWYTSNAHAVPLTDYAGTNTDSGGLWSNASAWQWDWQQNPAGTSVSYVTAPLSNNTTVIGGGAVDLWVRSSTPDVDLQATVSEVRPDGNETFVQNGWLRASERALSSGTSNFLDAPSTPVDPVPSLTTADAAPMPANRFVKVVIPLYDEGHVYRAGSRIRVTISAPNGTQPVWSFSQTQPSGTGTVSIAYSRAMPSSLVLPVVPGVKVPTPLPPCPSLRNEPCRKYRPTRNNTSTG